MPAFGLTYPVPGVDPPLGGVSTASDIPKGFLMARLEDFDFDTMANPYREVTPAERCRRAGRTS